MAREERFEVDGVSYESLDDVPQPFRDSLAALMADRDGDGVPDAFDRPTGSYSVVHHSETFEVDGVRYTSVDGVPEPQRSMLRDALPHIESAPGPPTTTPPPPAPLDRPSAATPTTPVDQPPPIVRAAGWSNRARLIALFVAVDAIAAGVIVWLLLR